MAARSTPKKPGTKKVAHGATSVDSFVSELEHPYKASIERLRTAILALDVKITEEIKWNAPSFKLSDHFATFKLHPPKQLQIVLHTGSKPIVPARSFKLDAPQVSLKWAAPDRCVITLASTTDAERLEKEVVQLVRQWIAQL